MLEPTVRPFGTSSVCGTTGRTTEHNSFPKVLNQWQHNGAHLSWGILAMYKTVNTVPKQMAMCRCRNNVGASDTDGMPNSWVKIRSKCHRTPRCKNSWDSPRLSIRWRIVLENETHHLQLATHALAGAREKSNPPATTLPNWPTQHTLRATLEQLLGNRANVLRPLPNVAHVSHLVSAYPAPLYSDALFTPLHVGRADLSMVSWYNQTALRSFCAHFAIIC